MIALLDLAFSDRECDFRRFDYLFDAVHMRSAFVGCGRVSGHVNDQVVARPTSSMPCMIANENAWQCSLVELQYQVFFTFGSWFVLNEASKRQDFAREWFVETKFVWCFPVLNLVVDVPQVGVCTSRLTPPRMTKARCIEYRSRPFQNSSHCVFSNAVRLRSVRSRRFMLKSNCLSGFVEFASTV